MDRRDFCKLTVLSTAGVGNMLLNANVTLAKGIPSGAFTGRGTDKCYVGPPKGVILTSQHWEDLDRVILAMLETGKALPAPFPSRRWGPAAWG